eukprot:3160178-Prymnesium_polylepis.1
MPRKAPKKEVHLLKLGASKAADCVRAQACDMAYESVNTISTASDAATIGASSTVDAARAQVSDGVNAISIDVDPSTDAATTHLKRTSPAIRDAEKA